MPRYPCPEASPPSRKRCFRKRASHFPSASLRRVLDGKGRGGVRARDPMNTFVVLCSLASRLTLSQRNDPLSRPSAPCAVPSTSRASSRKFRPLTHPGVRPVTAVRARVCTCPVHRFFARSSMFPRPNDFPLPPRAPSARNAREM